MAYNIAIYPLTREEFERAWITLTELGFGASHYCPDVSEDVGKNKKEYSIRIDLEHNGMWFVSRRLDDADFQKIYGFYGVVIREVWSLDYILSDSFTYGYNLEN